MRYFEQETGLKQEKNLSCPANTEWKDVIITYDNGNVKERQEFNGE